MQRTSSSGDMSATSFQTGLPSALAHRSHTALTQAPVAKWIAPLSGPIHRSWLSEGKVQLDIGIGINSGEMIAGNIGSTSIMSYTVIGDNVNLGSRLESLNKEFQSRIIISDATRTRLRTTPEMRPLGEVTVKGKSLAVSIFEVIVASPMADASHVPEEKQ